MYTNVKYLPLFSNIPDIYSSQTSEARKNKNQIHLVLFGAIHEATNFDLLIEESLSFEKKNKSKVILQLLGRNGSGQKMWEESWTNAGLQVNVIGEQPTNIIAHVLSDGHIGLTTSAYSMIEKSSAVATMLYFQLPILCVSKFEAPQNLSLVQPPFPVFEVRKGCLEACLKYSGNLTSDRNIDSVANQFIEDLKNAT